MNKLFVGRGTNPLAIMLTWLGLGLAAVLAASSYVAASPSLAVVAVLAAIAAAFVPATVMMANQWEKAVVLRLGKLRAIRGPGLFLIVPVIDAVASWVDQRIQTTEFTAEQALTRDTVPVNVDAIVFWQVHDVEKASLEITNYRQAISQVAQTSLREMIGSTPLSALLSERKKADAQLKDEIGRKTGDWGVAVISVEIRDVAIPPALQDAMSRQAQAEREREARVILGNAEREIAQKFVEAAEIYGQNAAAFQLRAMNIIYETTKERGATILIPTAMVDAMNPSTMATLTAALAKAAPKVG
jgi:regulator of protease activity HflC (stomatin/prohibitin superfamily)